MFSGNGGNLKMFLKLLDDQKNSSYSIGLIPLKIEDIDILTTEYSLGIKNEFFDKCFLLPREIMNNFSTNLTNNKILSMAHNFEKTNKEWIPVSLKTDNNEIFFRTEPSKISIEEKSYFNALLYIVVFDKGYLHPLFIKIIDPEELIKNKQIIIEYILTVEN